MVWVWRVGFMFNPMAPRSWAVYSGDIYGPYKLWFERKCWPIYWAVTPPYKFAGWLSV